MSKESTVPFEAHESKVEYGIDDILEALRVYALPRHSYVVFGEANQVIRGIRTATTSLHMIAAGDAMRKLINFHNARAITSPYTDTSNKLTNQSVYVEKNGMVPTYAFSFIADEKGDLTDLRIARSSMELQGSVPLLKLQSEQNNIITD